MTDQTSDEAYSSRVNAELEYYADPESVPGLPPIYSFWSERYCLPLIRELGFAGFHEMLDDLVAEQCARRFPEPTRLVSLGAGTGETEIGIADRLAQRGIENLEITLLELNPQLIEQGRADAEARGFGERVSGVPVDLNTWRADRPADIYFASHSLHHVVELENLFAEVRSSMDPKGILLINDMIGRNGHVRWPEAGRVVHDIWGRIPARYRYNNYLGYVDDTYPDIDCSADHFEGIRAQDILPLLLEGFHPDVYVTFANIADPFVDRVYGPNFDPDKPEDLAVIDAIGRLDDAAIDLGLVTPTHLIGAFRVEPVPCRYPRSRSPERTLRQPDQPVGTALGADDPSRDEPAQSAGNEGAETVDLDALRLSHAAAWGNYHHLRQRKAVRAALALATLRTRLISALRGRR
jgi:SAM-dependent methyltransferase